MMALERGECGAAQGRMGKVEDDEETTWRSRGGRGMRRGAREDGQGGGQRGDHVALERGECGAAQGRLGKLEDHEETMWRSSEGTAARRKGGWASWRTTGRSHGARG
jgi:hypothetical protein